jgi:hypothetical protein
MFIGGLGRLLIIFGLLIVVLGGLLLLMERGLPPGLSWIGRLPGDILIQRKTFTFYIPLATSLLLSVLLSLILYLFLRR